MSVTEEIPFWDHVEELRWRLFKSLLAIIFGAIIIHYFSDDLLIKLIRPSIVLNSPLNLQVIKVTSMFMIKLGMALMGGIVLSLPIIFYQTWCFVSPIFRKTYKSSLAIMIVGLSTLFFISGLYSGSIDDKIDLT